MKKNFLTGIGAAFNLTFAMAVGQAQACTPDELQSRVRADFALDIETGAALYERNADAVVSQASLTKRMVLLLVLEDIRAGRRHEDDWITLTSAHLQNARGEQQYTDPIDWPIKQVRLGDALFAMNQKSSNRVPNFFENAEFLQRMNDKARDLGLENTYFINTTGFPTAAVEANRHMSSSHRSTARDHAKIVAAIYREFPAEMQQFSKARKDFTGLNARGEEVGYTIKSSVHLLKGAGSGAPNVIGGKTGYICRSGHNMDVVALIAGRPIVFVTFGHDRKDARDLFVRRMTGHPNDEMLQALNFAKSSGRELTEVEMAHAARAFFKLDGEKPSFLTISYNFATRGLALPRYPDAPLPMVEKLYAKEEDIVIPEPAPNLCLTRMLQ